MKKSLCKFRVKTRSGLSVERSLSMEFDVNFEDSVFGDKTVSIYPLNDPEDAVYQDIFDWALESEFADGYLVNGNQFYHFEDVKLNQMNFGCLSLENNDLTSELVFAFEDKTSGSLR